MKQNGTYCFERFFNPNEASSEDGGDLRYFIAESDIDDHIGVSLSISSFDEEEKHIEFNSLVGKTVRITIEIID